MATEANATTNRDTIQTDIADQTTDLKGADNRDNTQVYDQIENAGLDQATFDERMLNVPGSTKDLYKAQSVTIDYSEVWKVLTSGTFPAGSFGDLIIQNIDESISSRASQIALNAVAAAIASLNDISPAEVKAEADQALIDYDTAQKDDFNDLNVDTTLIKRILFADGIIDETNKTLTMQDDDGVIHVWNLRDSAGNPSVSEIFERLKP